MVSFLEPALKTSYEPIQKTFFVVVESERNRCCVETTPDMLLTSILMKHIIYNMVSVDKSSSIFIGVQ
jgi:hypothetical protein